MLDEAFHINENNDDEEQYMKYASSKNIVKCRKILFDKASSVMKDSKAKSDDGKLLVMNHGSINPITFNTFDLFYC